MSDDEWALSDSTDPASARAGALVELALQYDSIKDAAVRERLLKAMDLLNEGIERIVRPAAKKGRPSLLPLRGGLDE